MTFPGWKQFLQERRRMLDAYDRAKAYQHSKHVQADHGKLAEAEFRRWLKSFLPRRYDVTSGFIISQKEDEDFSLNHFDVIVFDALNSPILWEEGNPDMSSQGVYRAEGFRLS